MFCSVLVMAKIFTNTKSLCRSYFKQKRCAFIIIWPLLVQELLFRKLPFHLSAIQCGLVFVALPVSIWWHFFLKALQILEIKVSVVAIVLRDFIFFFFFFRCLRKYFPAAAEVFFALDFLEEFLYCQKAILLQAVEAVFLKLFTVLYRSWRSPETGLWNFINLQVQ